jgi:uncharacterized protein YggE
MWQIITVLLVIIIVVILFMWKPWEPNIKASERTISVTGNATISSTPDEYNFSPNYMIVAADRQAAVNAVTAKADSVIKQLKSLGVEDRDLKTNSDGYSYGGKSRYTLSITIKVDDSKLAQKVQDYLLTTGPEGEVTPYVSFSKAKKEELQDKARSKAEKNARDKADQSARNLGFKVDAVKSVKDGDLGTANPYRGDIAVLASGASDQSATPHLNLQPGQNDLSYSVKVVYYIH